MLQSESPLESVRDTSWVHKNCTVTVTATVLLLLLLLLLYCYCIVTVTAPVLTLLLVLLTDVPRTITMISKRLLRHQYEPQTDWPIYWINELFKYWKDIHPKPLYVLCYSLGFSSLLIYICRCSGTGPLLGASGKLLFCQPTTVPHCEVLSRSSFGFGVF